MYPNWMTDRKPFKCKDKEIKQFLGTSTFTQYTICTEMSVVKVNPNVISRKLAHEACLIGCGVTTGMNSVRKTCKVEKGIGISLNS